MFLIFLSIQQHQGTSDFGDPLVQHIVVTNFPSKLFLP